MNVKETLFLLGAAVFLCGCSAIRPGAAEVSGTPKFKRLYTYFDPRNEEEIALMKKYHVAATSVGADEKDCIRLLNAAGIGAYANFHPDGWHASTLNEEEQKVYDYLSAADVPEKERGPEAKRRRIAGRYSYGGEPLPGVKFLGHDEVFSRRNPCIIGDRARELACRKLDRLCATPGIDGIAFDYISYSNYRGCEHPECMKLCMEYLKKHDLPDTKENRERFYLHEIVEYYRVCAAHIRKIDPRFKIMAHLFPVFLPHPLYGNRLDIDIAGETCAWYRIWDVKKVEAYSRYVVENQHKYHKNTQCVPFLAVSVSDLFDHKSPEVVERELRAILKSGTDTLMIHEFRSLIQRPEIMAVFDRYFE